MNGDALFEAEFAAWTARARAVTVAEEMARRGLAFRRNDAGQPCPACGGSDRFSVNARRNLWQCRASGVGGDAIALAQYLDGCDFLAACETVAGAPPPGRSGLGAAERAQMLAKAEREAAERAAAAAERQAAAAAESARRRAEERRRMWEFWRSAQPARGTLAEEYLARRGLVLPEGARLRFLPEMPYWADGQVVWRGPAMIAAIAGPDGRFAGAHLTWIDLGQPAGKLVLPGPDGEAAPAKKVRGSQRGGTIFLARGGAAWAGWTWFLGEGIETVLAVWGALLAAAHPLLDGAEFRSAVNLRNIGRAAAGRMRHPTRRIVDARGRVRAAMVESDEPAADDPYPQICLPDGVERLFLLGDGDSDPLATRNALLRGAKSFAQARPGLDIRLAMARPGMDFNDMAREA